MFLCKINKTISGLALLESVQLALLVELQVVEDHFVEGVSVDQFKPCLAEDQVFFQEFQGLFAVYELETD